MFPRVVYFGNSITEQGTVTSCNWHVTYWAAARFDDDTSRVGSVDCWEWKWARYLSIYSCTLVTSADVND